MIKCSFRFAVIFLLAACSNSTELETGAIKTIQMLKSVIDQPKNQRMFVNARKLLSRKQIDAAKIPVLFVELESGQNGTLTPYPGHSVGQIWLGADGATITLDRGVLKASRGMGDDLMGSTSSMPSWNKIEIAGKPYSRKISYLTGNNTIKTYTLECKIQQINRKERIKIWDVEFPVTKYKEKCTYKGIYITNTYHVDNKGIVRKSLQYHSETIGYVVIERLDR